MTEHRDPDPFADLFPPAIDSLRVAWHDLRIPGPPRGYELLGEEIDHPDPRRRFARRTVQCLSCGDGRRPQSRIEDCETLALIDKASPHSRYDLMLSEVSLRPKSTPVDVHPATGRALWRTGANFVRFCSDRSTVEEFGLAGGELHLALNCDPNTQDRESVQAAKQFHLHLLYWDAPSLAPLSGARALGEIGDWRLRRQALDPLSFLGARLVTEALGGLDLRFPGVTLLPADGMAALRGERPLGAVIRLPGWGPLDSPDFEDLVRRIHQRLESLAVTMAQTFTGRPDTPAPWVRHPLLMQSQILSRIQALPYSEEVKAGLGLLARVLRELDPDAARRLRGASPTRRMSLMTLNQPSYALNLHAGVPRPGDRQDGDIGAPEVDLIIQPKLFSGIGGAGLLTLGGIASVRVLRGQGTFSDEQWHHRAHFQRAFARFNQERLTDGQSGLRFEPRRRFVGAQNGWMGRDH